MKNVFTTQSFGSARGRYLSLVQWSVIPQEGFTLDKDEGERMSNQARAAISATPLYKKSVMYDKTDKVMQYVEELRAHGAIVKNVLDFEHEGGRKELAQLCQSE